MGLFGKLMLFTHTQYIYMCIYIKYTPFLSTHRPLEAHP